jgi:transmembrane sensor
MEPGNKPDEILIKYWLEDCSEAEDNFVKSWLNNSETNRLYFESLKDSQRLVEIKQIINKIDVDQEWQHCQQSKESNQQNVFELPQFENKREELYIEGYHTVKTRVLRWMIPAAAAVLLMFAIIFGLDYLNVDKLPHPVTDMKGKVRPVINDPLMLVMLHRENTTGKIEKIRLPDGSQVALFSNSELTYRQPSQKNRREVLLKGKAKFNVVKDRTSPFTVFSANISTTALGPQFTIRAIPKEKYITVRLDEGKVVVRSNKDNGTNKMNDMYLVPGLEMVYDRNRGTAIVQLFTVAGKQRKKEILTDDKTSENTLVPSYGRRSWFMFNKQPLNEIFDALSEMYHVKIYYAKKDINKMYFISMFDKSDSLENILQQIASINNLVVIKDSNTYRVKKQVSKEAN